MATPISCRTCLFVLHLQIGIEVDTLRILAVADVEVVSTILAIDQRFVRTRAVVRWMVGRNRQPVAGDAAAITSMIACHSVSMSDSDKLCIVRFGWNLALYMMSARR